MLPWVLLTIAGLLEVVWAYWLKQTHGFTRLWPSVITLGAMIASFALLARAMQSLPLGISYTVWVGIGAVGSVAVGALLLGERLSPLQGVCIAMIALGILGLKLTTRTPPAQPSPAAPSAPPNAAKSAP